MAGACRPCSSVLTHHHHSSLLEVLLRFKCVVVLVPAGVCVVHRGVSLTMEGSGVPGGVKKEVVEEAAQGATWLRAEEPPMDTAEEIIRDKEEQAGAAKRPKEDSENESAMGLGVRKKRQRVAAAAPSSSGRKRTTGARARAAAAVLALPRCRCSMRLSQPPLQRLLDACRDVFTKGSPTPPTSIVVPFMRRLMDKIGPHDVGLMDDLNYFHSMNAAGCQNPPIITSKTIYNCSNFMIAVFFLPLRAVMPLHDHPGMTVFSKLLIGSVRVEAYDWVRPRVSSRGSAAMLAEKVLDRNVTAASDAWVLFPDTGGNMHRFVVGEEEHCAFLDVLTPPYSLAEQRTCTYYKDIPYDELDTCAASSGLTEAQRRRQLAWLQEVPQPKDLRMYNLPYKGPTIF
ncbi:unnamed protein product [Urochloa decumbens]|uniref:cysteine dioxygenase n=1 Tax=Urochloa decumbens TaxID=240449 RepID=A0ABC8XK27_9POAL